MKNVLSVAFLSIATVMTAAPIDASGRWKLVYAGPKEEELKTIGSMVLDITAVKDDLTGTARIGSWPGEAPISDGKVDGDRITFTATGHLSSTTGIPTCQFVGTVEGDEMVLTMTVIRNSFTKPGAAYLFKGKKQSGRR